MRMREFETVGVGRLGLLKTIQQIPFGRRSITS